MTRALRKLVKWSYFLIALALILLAVLVQSGRSFSHLLGDYNHSIADYFSSKLNAQVAIGQIQADWDGLKPSLVIQDFSIKSQADEPIVALKQARLRLDMLESLLNLRLVWSNLSLSQVDMTFAQTSDGFWQIPGLPKRADTDKPGVQLDSLLDMLLLSTKIEFQSSHLSFQFTSGKRVQLASPYLLLENAGDFHRLALQIDLDEQPRSVYLIIEGQGDPRDQASFRSKGYVQLNRFPTSEPIAATTAFLLNGVNNASVLSEGVIDANIWFESRTGKNGYDLVGRLGLERLSLPLGERRLALDNFATDLTGYWLPSGEWRLGLQQINAGMNEQKISDVNLAVASTGFKQPLHVSMDKLDLGRLGDLLKSAGVLGEGRLRDVLTTLSPHGHVRNLQLSLPLQAPKEWQMRANLDQVAVNAWQGVPALTGVKGYLQAGQKGGYVEIDTQQRFTMHYSPTYSAPMEYDRAKGQVAWHLQPEKNQIYVNSGQLEFQSGDEVVRGYMWLSLPWRRNTGDIDLYLQIGARQLNASLYQKYTPAVVPQSLHNWLEQSIGANNAGFATQAGFVYRGTLNTKNAMARTYQLYLDIEQAELNYHPGWPALTQLDGRLLVSDAQVFASVTDARLFTSQVTRAEVRVNPRVKGAGSLLQVDSEISGAASDGIRVLREGMLRQYLGNNMDSWFMQGDMRARLDLTIPIGTGQQQPDDAHQRVDVALDVPRFELQNLNLAVNDLTGHISYSSDTGISSDTLSAELFDQPIEARLSTRKFDSFSKTLIEINGNVDAQKIAFWSKRPEALFLSGNLPYRARVELNHRPSRPKNWVELNEEMLSPEESVARVQSAAEFAEEAFAEVTVTSNLDNVRVDLPAPYGKPAKGERPFEFKLWLQENQAQIGVRYNNDMQVLLRTDREQNNQLLNANIALASEAQLSDHPQFLVTGFLPGIDLDAWKEVQGRYNTYTERLAPAVAQALSSRHRSAPEPEPAAGLVAGLPFRAELMLGQYELGSTLLENLNVIAVPVRVGWQLEVENAVVAGKLLVPDSPFIPLQVDLARLSLTKEMLGQGVEILPEDTSNPSIAESPMRPIEVIDPRKLPLANISIDALVMDDNNYGKWSLQLRPNKDGVVIDEIRGSIRGVTVSGPDDELDGARLIWQNTPTGVQSRFIGNLGAGDLGQVLRAWDKPDTLESKTAHFNADLFWPGSPQDFSVVNLGGEMSIAIETGRFKREANAGDGLLRLMSILNFDTLARRLRFDFSDLYKSGLAYDSINGKVRFNQGTMVFEEPLIVRTPSSGMQMAGSVDLRNETINTRLVATLPVAGNVTFYAALATGLPAAAGVYLISKLFKKQVDQATSVSYTIKGSWDEPKMRFNRLFESEKSLRESVNEADESLPPDKPSSGTTSKKQ